MCVNLNDCNNRMDLATLQYEVFIYSVLSVF